MNLCASSYSNCLHLDWLLKFSYGRYILKSEFANPRIETTADTLHKRQSLTIHRETMARLDYFYINIKACRSKWPVMQFYHIFTFNCGPSHAVEDVLTQNLTSLHGLVKTNLMDF